MPSAANMVYVPNSSPAVPVAASQPEIGPNTYASRPSMPIKVAQYSNLTVGNGGSGSQFSQPVRMNKYTDILSLVCMHAFLSVFVIPIVINAVTVANHIFLAYSF